MKSKNPFLQVLQIKIKEFCKITKMTKEEVYSELKIISTKNLPMPHSISAKRQIYLTHAFDHIKCLSI